MNIFLPYENNIKKSIECLDDVRLNKQLVECYQLLTSAIKEKNGEQIKGHKNHPIYLFYKNNIKFLSYYGWKCCEEYFFRFSKSHKLRDFFINIMYDLFIEYKDKLVPQPSYIPYYMEGSKYSIDCIRTTKKDVVSQLFQAKLINKWLNDKKQPKWTDQKLPNFFEIYSTMTKQEQTNYWQNISILKSEVKYNEKK